MKTKSISQMADLISAVQYLKTAQARASAGGEAVLAGLIGGVAQKVELAVLNSKKDERKA